MHWPLINLFKLDYFILTLNNASWNLFEDIKLNITILDFNTVYVLLTPLYAPVETLFKIIKEKVCSPKGFKNIDFSKEIGIDSYITKSKASVDQSYQLCGTILSLWLPIPDSIQKWYFISLNSDFSIKYYKFSMKILNIAKDILKTIENYEKLISDLLFINFIIFISIDGLYGELKKRIKAIKIFGWILDVQENEYRN